MRSITIHNLGEPLYRSLASKARRDGRSLNRTIKSILEEALGVTAGGEHRSTNVFQDLCGILPRGEAERLLKMEEEFETIDEEQ